MLTVPDALEYENDHEYNQQDPRQSNHNTCEHITFYRNYDSTHNRISKCVEVEVVLNWKMLKILLTLIAAFNDDGGQC